MLKKHNKHGPMKWFAGVLAATGLLLALPTAQPVYAAGDTGSSDTTVIQTAYVGFSAVSGVKVNDVSVKRYGHYSLSFNGNGNTGGSMDNQTDILLDKKLTLTNGYTKTGYHFTGWKDGSGNDYQNGQKADADTLGASDGATVTLTAQWSPNRYKVRFNKNRDSASGVMADQEFTYDETGVLNNNMFTEEGYQFLGWSTSPTGKAEYTNMNRIVRNLTAEDGGVVNLYAQWTDGALNIGKLVKDSPSHQHIYVTKYDDTYHWKECTVCGKVIDKEKHTMSDIVWPFADQPWVDRDGNDGVSSCTCGYSKTYHGAHEYRTTPSSHTGFGDGHWYQCIHPGCNMARVEPCTHNGVPIENCQTGGKCDICGGTFQKGRHILVLQGKDLVCKYCGEHFATIVSDTLTPEQDTHYWNHTITVKPITGTFQNGYQKGQQKNVVVNNYDYNASRPVELKSGSVTKNSDGSYTVKQRFYTTYAAGPVYPVWRYNNISINGIEAYEDMFQGQSGAMRVDTSAPSVSDPVITYSGSVANFHQSAEIKVSGTDEGGSVSVRLSIQNDEGETVYTGTQALSSGRFMFDTIPAVEASGTKAFTMYVTDGSGNTTTKKFTLSDVDASAPVLLNPLNNKGKWSRSVEWTADVTESGSGNVKIGMNQVKDMNDSSRITGQNGHYYKKYVFNGDKYDVETYRVFTEDAAGNLASYEMNIGKLDNTAPHVNKVEINGMNVSVTADDKNTSLGEGSGVAKYGYIDVATGTAIVEEKNASFTLPHAGKYLIVAYDAVGNLSDPYTITVGENAGAKRNSKDTIFDPMWND